jgi:hypothetical protein
MSIDSSKINGVADAATGTKDTQPVTLAPQRIAECSAWQRVGHSSVSPLDSLYRGTCSVALFIRAAYPLALLRDAVVGAHRANAIHPMTFLGHPPRDEVAELDRVRH